MSRDHALHTSSPTATTAPPQQSIRTLAHHLSHGRAWCLLKLLYPTYASSPALSLWRVEPTEPSSGNTATEYWFGGWRTSQISFCFPHSTDKPLSWLPAVTIRLGPAPPSGSAEFPTALKLPLHSSLHGLKRPTSTQSPQPSPAHRFITSWPHEAPMKGRPSQKLATP